VSEESYAEIVRQPIRISDGSHRRLEERIAVRFSNLAVAVTRALFRLPARSRVRRLVLARTVRLSAEASNRGDYEVAFLLFHPDMEFVAPAGGVVLGTFPERLQGRRERIQFERSWRGDWGEFRYEPEELIDLTDHLLLIGHMIGSGRRSGAATESEWAGLYSISRGQVIREQIFVDFRIELDGVDGVDSKRVIAFLRTSGTGRASGIRMTPPPLTNVYDLLDGKISHIRIFLDREEALKAVGLEE
jgi:ketosteroid isomerase-like protein